MPPLRHGEITEQVISAFYRVYNTLGYGYLESVYAAAMERELMARRLDIVRELAVQVYYDGQPIAFQKLDFVVERKVVVELKASSSLAAYAERQVLNYLRGTRLEVGLLLHFGPKASFRRIVQLRPAPGDPDNPDHPDDP